MKKMAILSLVMMTSISLKGAAIRGGYLSEEMGEAFAIKEAIAEGHRETFRQLSEQIRGGQKVNFVVKLNQLPDIKYAGVHGETLVHVAALTIEHGEKFLKIMADYDPDYNKKDSGGYTPLMVAVWKRYVQGVEFLLPRTDTMLKNNDGKTVYDMVDEFRGELDYALQVARIVKNYQIAELREQCAAAEAREKTLRGTIIQQATLKRPREDDVFDAPACHVCCESEQDGHSLQVTDSPCGVAHEESFLCRGCFDKVATSYHKCCPFCTSPLLAADGVEWKEISQLLKTKKQKVAHESDL